MDGRADPPRIASFKWDGSPASQFADAVPDLPYANGKPRRKKCGVCAALAGHSCSKNLLLHNLSTKEAFCGWRAEEASITLGTLQMKIRKERLKMKAKNVDRGAP